MVHYETGGHSLERTKAAADKGIWLLRFVTKPASLFSKPAETADQLLAKFADYAVAGNSVGLEDLRDRVMKVLAESDTRIAVLIDDIDRLDQHETHTLFRLVKACADFPNVTYVLSFDDAAVARSLGSRYEGGDERAGRAFLDKIVQVPLRLPIAAREDLRALCVEQVNRAVSAAGIRLSEQEEAEFLAGFDRSASLKLTTPRSAKRYGNCLMFAMPSLAHEVNPVDLLLVEALHAFFPETHDTVRENHSDFSGVEPTTVSGSA